VGIPAPLVEAVVHEGLLVPQIRDGRSGYTLDDVDVLRAGLRLLEAGFPLNDLLALARRHHDATRSIAGDAVKMFDEHVRRPLQGSDLADDEKAERLVEAFRTLLPTVTTLVAHHFRSVLLEVAQEHLESVGDATELAAARNEPGWEPAES
jgi:DNA-binding transcriptional MerR regulator